ncbi:MAG: hypothetical protein K6E77_10040 [Lachnospiraceae bacterium]|nr:hypothetical protein [Lachnospiraceae bacterium]
MVKTDNKTKYSAMVCYTRLQMMHCINYSHNSHDEIIDLYVNAATISDAFVIKERLDKKRVFRSIYIYNIDNWKFSKAKVILTAVRDSLLKNTSYKNTADNVLDRNDFSSRYFVLQNNAKIIKMTSGSVKEKIDYDIIYSTWPDDMVLQLLVCNKGAEHVLYDDGLGSHSYDMFEFGRNPDTLARFNRYGLDIEKFRPKRLLLSWNEKTENNYMVEVLPMLKEQEDLKELLKFVFDYKETDLYRNNRYFFLSQPYAKDDRFNFGREQFVQKEYKCFEMMNRLLGSFVMRLHPAEQKSERQRIPGAELDQINNMWELQCLNDIKEDSVLIGMLSTAQYTPKYLLGKEPYVLFLYKVCFTGTDFYKESDLEKCYALKNSYIDKEKIMIPDDLDELEECLKKLVAV